MKSSKPPAPPDPGKTAAAQNKYNRQAAITSYGLSATNQSTPWGNLTYSQIGTWEDGTPRYEAKQTLSPEMQRLFDLYTGTQTQLGNIAGNQAGAVESMLSQPLELSNEAVESRLWDLGRTRLDPVFSERRADLESDLRNRGVLPGSDAYNTAVRQFEQGRNDAYNNLLLSGRQQAVGELLTERNQPLEEIQRLLGISGPQRPDYVSTPGAGVQPVDYTGLVNNSYNARLNNWQTEQQRKNAMLGALFGTAATAVGGWGQGGFRFG